MRGRAAAAPIFHQLLSPKPPRWQRNNKIIAGASGSTDGATHQSPQYILQLCWQCNYGDYSFYRTQINLGSDLWVRMSVSPRRLSDLTDVTLTDEDTNSIITDNAIQGNASDVTWWPTLSCLRWKYLWEPPMTYHLDMNKSHVLSS